ncbi:MAG: DUF5053 domain-containing protein [Tenacibaculum sp.]
MKTTQKVTMQQKMWDIIVDIKWASISTKYFGKSRSWLSQKMNGNGRVLSKLKQTCKGLFLL